MANNIPSDLLISLVANGIWSPTQGLTYARLISDEESRAMAFTGLLQFIPQNLVVQVYRELLEAVRSIKYDYNRLDKLAALMRDLPDPFKSEALDEMRAVKDKELFAIHLIELAPDLSEPLKAEVLDAVLTIEDKRNRVNRLVQLMPYLSDPLKRKALKIAQEAAMTIEYEPQRACALASIVPYLPEPLKDNVLSEALMLTKAMQDEQRRVSVLKEMAKHLTEPQKTELLDEALKIVRTKINIPNQRIFALADLVPHLSKLLKDEVLTEALAMIRKEQDERVQRTALVTLAPYLPINYMAEALNIARNIARNIQDEWHRASVFVALAPRLPGGLLKEILYDARTMHGYKTLVLTKVISYWPEDLPEDLLAETQDDALKAALNINYQPGKAKALVELAPHLPEPLRKEALLDALTAAQAILDGGHQAGVIAALSTYLPKQLIGEAVNESLSAIPKKDCDWSSVADILIETIKILTKIALRLQENKRSQLLSEMLLVSRSFINKSNRFNAFKILLPHLPRSIRDKEFKEVKAVNIEGEQGQQLAFSLTKLSALTPYLSSVTKRRVLREALTAARALSDSDNKDVFLAELSLYLPWRLRSKVVREALNVSFSQLRFFGGGWMSTKVLTLVAPHLPWILRGRVLRKSLTIIGWYVNSGSSYVNAVAAVAPHLPRWEKNKFLKEALAVARTIKDDKAFVASKTKDETEQTNMQKQAKAMVSLVPHLPRPILSEICSETLQLARGIKNEGERSMVLTALLLYLPEPLKGEILVEAVTTLPAISEAWDLTSTLAKLVPHLKLVPHFSEKLLANLLMAALSINKARIRVKALNELSPLLEAIPSPILYPLLRDAFRIFAKRERKELFNDILALAGVIAKLGGEKAVYDTFMATKDISRWWP